MVAACLVAAVIVGVISLFVGNVPLPNALPAAQSSTLFAADGNKLAQFHGTEDRTIVPLTQISTNLQQAVVAAEDRTFFTDGGVSLRGTLRAFWVDITGRSIAQGGSTITQQYVRNVFSQVGRQRTIVRKLKEATLAIKFERKYSKNKILEDYLNTVYFGRGAYGAQAAAEAYFGTTAADLTMAQAAYLAGIIRGPEFYQPDTNPKGTTQIRDVVLSDMVQAHYLSTSQANAAKSQQLQFSAGASSGSARGAYFIEYVRRVLSSQYHISEQQIQTGGLKVYTTLDPRLQDAAEAAISSTLNSPTDPQVAMVSMDVNGSVRAMVGGRNVNDVQAAQGFNFAYQQSAGGGRQAGSSFKPFTLAAFIQAGYSIASTFQAPPSIEVTSKQCKNLDGSNWPVNNFNKESFPGDLNLTQATADSVNTIYAQLVNKLGPKTVTNLAQQIGGWNNLSPVCSITLGTSAATPLEMARAYATFAAQGQRPNPIAVTKVISANGKILVDQTPHSEPVLDSNVANTVTQVLTQVLVNGTAAGKGIGRPAAGKTGTTDQLTDAWFVGYTPSLSTAVWMGYATTDPKTQQTVKMNDVHGIQVTGGTLPATIWQKFMNAAVAGTKVESFVSPKLGGRVIGPPGAPCPAGVQPSPDWACVPPGTTCFASATTPVNALEIALPVPLTATVSPSPSTPSTPSASPSHPAPKPSAAGKPTPGATPLPTPGPTDTPSTGVPGPGVPTPCPAPSEMLPPDIIIPSPSSGSSGPASPHALGTLAPRTPALTGVR
ncbi:MAG: penicillin-binding protein 1A [Actinomycetota bacterium]